MSLTPPERPAIDLRLVPPHFHSWTTGSHWESLGVSGARTGRRLEDRAAGTGSQIWAQFGSDWHQMVQIWDF